MTGAHLMVMAVSTLGQQGSGHSLRAVPRKTLFPPLFHLHSPRADSQVTGPDCYLARIGFTVTNEPSFLLCDYRTYIFILCLPDS